MWPISLRKLLDNDRQDDQGELDSKDRPGHFTIDLPVTFKRRGVETKLVIADQ